MFILTCPRLDGHRSIKISWYRHCLQLRPICHHPWNFLPYMMAKRWLDHRVLQAKFALMNLCSLDCTIYCEPNGNFWFHSFRCSTLQSLCMALNSRTGWTNPLLIRLTDTQTRKAWCEKRKWSKNINFSIRDSKRYYYIFFFKWYNNACIKKVVDKKVEGVNSTP